MTARPCAASASVTLVLNSPLVDHGALRRLAPGSVLIGVDGGLNHIVGAGLLPHWAVGDFDSVQPAVLKKAARSMRMLRFPRQKDFTDFEFGLKLAGLYRPAWINVLGLHGGPRIDHQLVNSIMLDKLARSGCVVRAWGSSCLLFFTARSTVLSPARGRHFSVFALGEPVTVTIRRALFPTSRTRLLPGSGLGLGNEVSGRGAEIHIHQGTACISQWQTEDSCTPPGHLHRID